MFNDKTTAPVLHSEALVTTLFAQEVNQKGVAVMEDPPQRHPA